MKLWENAIGMSEDCEVRPNRRSGAYVLKRMLWVNFLAAVGAGLIVVALFHPAQRSEIQQDFAHSFVYSFMIGGLITLAFQYFPWKRWKFHALQFPLNWGLIACIILACALTGTLLADLLLLASGFLSPGRFWASFLDHAPFCAIIALMFGGGAFAYELFRSNLEATALALRTRQLEEERLRKSAVEAQLASLESHIRPHFLFNTLNTISSLIPEDPVRAEALVGKLAAVLRLSLDSNQQRLAPIEKELKLVRDYLEIERARFGARLRFEIDVPACLQSLEVPSFSLQTLVENSVKYAVAPSLAGALIRLAVFERDGAVCLQVSDDGPGFTSEAIRPGHGLANLQGRLSGLFGAGARLEVANGDGITSVRLFLPRSEMRAAV